MDDGRSVMHAADGTVALLAESLAGELRPRLLGAILPGREPLAAFLTPARMAALRAAMRRDVLDGSVRDVIEATRRVVPMNDDREAIFALRPVHECISPHGPT